MPTCFCSTRSSRSATRRSSASASARSSSSSSAAARSSSSRTTPRRSSGCASARCCCARAGSSSTARRTRRSCATGSVLAAEADPAERAAGLREWGSGEATIAGARLRRRRGERAAAVPRRRAVLAPPADRGRERDRAAAAPARAARRGGPARRLGRARHRPASAGPTGTRELRYDVDRLPLSDGRFHLRLGPRGRGGERLLHWLDDALVFLVYPAGEERGVVRLEGSWTAEENSESAMSSRTCPTGPT